MYGQQLNGEAIRVAFPSALDAGPGDWRDISPALLSSYCDDQNIDLYTYKHENLQFAENPYTVGDYVVKTSHDDPNMAVVVENDAEDGRVTVVYEGPQGDEVTPTDLAGYCDSEGLSTYEYAHSELDFADMGRY